MASMYPPPPLPNTFAIDPNFRVGYSQNWQLSVPITGLAGGTAWLTATYQGGKGTRGNAGMSCRILFR